MGYNDPLRGPTSEWLVVLFQRFADLSVKLSDGIFEEVFELKSDIPIIYTESDVVQHPGHLGI